MQLHTNVRAGLGRPKDLTLGLHTVVVGKNGAGKTRIALALRLALTGRIDEVDDLTRLIPTGEDTLTSTLILDDRALTYADGKATEIREVDQNTYIKTLTPHEWTLPVQRLMEGLRLPVDERRAFLQPLVSHEVTAADIRAKIAAQPLITFFSDVIPDNDEHLTLDALYDEAASAMQKANASALALVATATIVSRGDALLPCPTAEDLKSAADQVAEITTIVEKARRASSYAGKKAEREAAEAQVTELQAQIDKEQAAVELLVAKSAELSSSAPPMHELLSHGQTASDATIVAGLNNCVACGSAVTAESLGAWRGQLDGAITAFREEYEVRQRALAQQQDEIQTAQRNVAEIEIQLTDLTKRLADLDFEIAEGPIPSPLPEGLTIEEAESAQKLAQELNDQLQALVGQWAEIERARETGRLGAADTDFLMARAEAVKRIADDLLDASVEAFRERVQKYLPPDRRFAFALRNAFGVAVCVVGLEKDGRVEYPSGADETILLFALAAAILDRMPEKPSNAYLLPMVDTAWDADSISAAMRALTKVPYPVLLLSTVLPKRAPDDWTVLDLEEFNPKPTRAPRKKPEVVDVEVTKADEMEPIELPDGNGPAPQEEDEGPPLDEQNEGPPEDASGDDEIPGW